MTVKNIFSSSRTRLLALCLALFLTAAPAPVFAQCEIPGRAATAANNLITRQDTAVKSLVTRVKAAYLVDVEKMRAALGMKTVAANVLAKMNVTWRRWNLALKAMTKQISASTVHGDQQLSQIQDASNVISAALEMQKADIKSKITYQPTEQACRFDTAGGHLAANRRVSSAIASGYALDFVKVGDNNKDTPAGGGYFAHQKALWAVYQQKFCDGSAYNGRAGCQDTNLKQNMHVLPASTILGRETIDLRDEDTKDAVNQMIFNITGYRAPDTLQVRALDTSGGMEQRQINREYIAQMDAVGSLIYSIVAERAPGEPAPEIQAARQRMGILDASPVPSVREIRESIVEQLWDPSYYKDLYDNPGTVAQKELYLKAYSLVMLYDMIAKQEKISNVYAIETADMLNALGGGRYGVLQGLPHQ